MSLKQGKFYYSLMNDRDKMRFKGNVHSQNANFERIMNREYGCFDCFLKDSFDWNLSMQGFSYWQIVSKQIASKGMMRRKDLFLIWFLFFFLIFIFSYNYLTNLK